MEQKLKKAAIEARFLARVRGAITQVSNCRSQSFPARLSNGAVLMTLSHGNWDHQLD